MRKKSLGLMLLMTVCFMACEPKNQAVFKNSPAPVIAPTSVKVASESYGHADSAAVSTIRVESGASLNGDNVQAIPLLAR